VLEEQLYAGMEALAGIILGREWKRDGGGVERVKLCLIDGNWPESKNVVYQFCRQSPFAALLLPSRSKGYGVKETPISEKAKREGVRRGLEWEIPPPAAGRPKQHVHWDTNFWKSHVHARLAAPKGARAAITLYGDDDVKHRMLSEHLTAEFPVHVEIEGRAIDVWQAKVGEDNHWLDCLVGSAVAASIQGVYLKEVHASNKPSPRQHMTLEERKQRARGGR
jgi:phage terminase large subunit GpA-like protein